MVLIYCSIKGFGVKTTMAIFSLIVARAGSQGFKNKNIRMIGEKAVFEYSIEYSMKLNNIINDEVFTIVSSDSKVIQKYCKKNSIHFIKRKSELAKSDTRIEDVIYDAYQEIGKHFDYISLLAGNIITRYTDEFLKAYSFLEENIDYDCLFSMENVERYNPQQMFELNEDVLPKKKMTGYMRQDLKQLMYPDGHTMLFRSGHFLKFMKNNSCCSGSR